MQRASGHAMGEEFVRHDAANGRLQADLFTARIVPILEAAAAGVLIALLAGRLFGTAAGVFAALLWLLNPFVIGLGHLDGIDIPATFTTLLTALAVLHARRKPSACGAVLVGVCAGLAILARVTGLLVVVMAAAALLECDWRDDRRRACARGVTVVGVAWATVIAAYAVLSPVDIIGGGHGVARVLATFGHVVVPPAWLRGTGHLLRVGSKPGPSFVLGQPADGRSLLFWPGEPARQAPSAHAAGAGRRAVQLDTAVERRCGARPHGVSDCPRSRTLCSLRCSNVRSDCVTCCPCSRCGASRLRPS